MKFLIKINSISNAITNSSSEVFLIKTKRPSEEIKNLILDFGRVAAECDGDKRTCKMEITMMPRHSREIIENNKFKFPSDNSYEGGSGMGMELDVYDYTDAKREYKKHYGKDLGEILKEKGISEEEINRYILIDIDRERGKTIDFIKNNFDYYIEETKKWDSNEDCDKVYDILSWASKYMYFIYC